MAAATRTVRCFEAIRERALGTPATLDQENDPEASGLIGQEFTLTTTDRGVLEAKLTSVNPNFAAVFVEYFHELGLRPGDPGRDRDDRIVPGAQHRGARRGGGDEAQAARRSPRSARACGERTIPTSPGSTWRSCSNDKGCSHTRSVAASIGGSNDRGRGLSPEGRAPAARRDRAQRHSRSSPSRRWTSRSTRRVEIYDQEAGPRGVRAYVNIGGGSASIGNAQSAKLITPGRQPDAQAVQLDAAGRAAPLREPGRPDHPRAQRRDRSPPTHGLPLAPEIDSRRGRGGDLLPGGLRSADRRSRRS